LRRLTPALFLLPFFAAGCNASPETYPCPGTPVATFAFGGTRAQMSCAGGAPAAGANAIYPDQITTFTGTISAASSSATAALCVARPGAEPLVGTLLADTLDVALDSRGALLAGCNARCAVTIHQQVTGTLLRQPDGTPSGFTGTLVDQATLDTTVAGADCTPCTTPCTATYALSSPPPGP